MARDFNQNRIANAILGQATIDKYGNTFAVQFGLDGINVANVTVQPAPSSIIPYLEGDDTITTYAVPINVDELCDYALASFPNIEELTLFSLTMVTFDETNLLSYLANLDTVYVPQSLLSAYQSAYPNITFDEITVDYTYIVEDYTQDHILTSSIVTEQLNALTSQQRNAITKLVIASSYTSASANSVVWGYTFGTLLPYLNNNVWYNSVKYDFTTCELTGVDELLESDIDNLINGISSDKINGVTQLKFSGFSDISVVSYYDFEYLISLEYVWLDNIRYDANELTNVIVSYQKVEYIESSGTQYIDTLFKPNQNIKIELDFNYTINQDKRLFGTRVGYRNSQFEFVTFAENTNFQVRFGNENYEVSRFSTGRHTLSLDKNIYKLDNNSTTISNSQIFNVTYNLCLFAYNNAGDVQALSTYEMYSCKLYDNGDLIRNFIPCYRITDNVIGLYDIINKQFYTNQGSGTFLKGNDTAGYSPTYFYPISDLVSEYDATKEQTWYLDYNGILPISSFYSLTWYSDENCTTTISASSITASMTVYVKLTAI